MFSVTRTFSHCDLALVLRKQSGFFLTFSLCEEFCCWKTQPICGLKKRKCSCSIGRQCPTAFSLSSQCSPRCHCWWVNPELRWILVLKPQPCCCEACLGGVGDCFIHKLSKHFKTICENPCSMFNSQNISCFGFCTFILKCAKRREMVPLGPGL